MLEVKAIDTFRGPAHILHGVSLSVGAQEVVCLVGRNGAGKTTTIESIMGFLPVRAGEIVFAGENLNRLPPHERARRGIGYSPEDCGVFPELSVGENLMISRWLGEEVVRKRGRRARRSGGAGVRRVPGGQEPARTPGPAPLRRPAQDGGGGARHDAVADAAAAR